MSRALGYLSPSNKKAEALGLRKKAGVVSIT